MILKSFLVLNLLTALQPIETEKEYAAPNIISLETDYPRKGIWVHIPKGTKEISINVRAENTETVLFWLMPTGTETWNNRKLIGYDIKENEKDNQFNLTWDIDRPYLLDHLYIQALGQGIANDTVNLIME